MSRIGRRVAETALAYRSIDSDVRARFEAAIGAAARTLQVSDEIPFAVRTLLKDVLLMALTEGFVGGSWTKVRIALQTEWPELWHHLEPLVPGK
jgi:hypothetical protein